MDLFTFPLDHFFFPFLSSISHVKWTGYPKSDQSFESAHSSVDSTSSNCLGFNKSSNRWRFRKKTHRRMASTSTKYARFTKKYRSFADFETKFAESSSRSV